MTKITPEMVREHGLSDSEYARILELRFGDELTVPEIARLLLISESAAESQLVRARQAFRAEWQRADASPEPRVAGMNHGDAP